MQKKSFVPMVVLCAFAAFAIADDRTYKEKTTVKGPEGTFESKTTIKGEVVRLDPGKSIVLRDEGGKEVTYQLSAQVQVPVEVQVGKTVMIHTQPNSMTVQHIILDSGGRVSGTATETLEPPSTTSQVTYYTVRSIEPGKSITVVTPQQKVMTFTLDRESLLPPDLTPGKRITIETGGAQGTTVVRRVTLFSETP